MRSLLSLLANTGTAGVWLLLLWRIGQPLLNQNPGFLETSLLLATIVVSLGFLVWVLSGSPLARGLVVLGSLGRGVSLPICSAVFDLHLDPVIGHLNLALAWMVLIAWLVEQEPHKDGADPP